MTALNVATDIPSDINTLEKLAMWVILASERVNPSLAVLETDNSSVRVAQATMVRASDGTVRLIGRLSVPLDPEYSTDNSKQIWEFAEEWSQTILPAGFKVNA